MRMLAFAVGCLLVPLFPKLPAPTLLVGLLLATLLMGVAVPILWHRAQSTFRSGPAGSRYSASVVRHLPGWLIAMLGGLLLTSVTAHRAMQDAWPIERDGEMVRVTGKIVGLTEIRERRFRFDLKTSDHRTSGVPRRVRVDWYAPRYWPNAGETWEMDLRLRSPGGRANPGGFDGERWMLAQRVGATANVGNHAVRVHDGATVHTTRLRQYLAEWLQAATYDLDAASLHRALVVADRGGLSAELSELLRRTGTAHLLAISGMHVGMVFAVAALLAGALAMPLSLIHARLDRRRVAVVLGLLVAIGYAGLAGFTLPTQRALVMLAVVVGALVLRRNLRPGHTLLVALVAVLVVDPLAPLASGFWLSFAAVAVLIWAFAWRSVRSGWWRGLLRAQIIVAIGLLPLNAGAFQQIVPISIPANLLAIPVTGLVVLPMLLLAVAMKLTGLPFTEWPLLVSESILKWAVLKPVAWLETLPAAWWATAGTTGLPLAMATLGGFWLIAPRGTPGRWLGLALLLPLFVNPVTRMGDNEFDVWVMDAGSGFAVLIQTRSENWLFDTGRGDGDGADQVAGMIEPLLRHTGRPHLNGLILSQENRNHTGGLPSVLLRLQPQQILAGPGLPYTTCQEGQHWEVDGVVFRVVHPRPGLPALGGDSGCIIALESDGQRVLIAGAAGVAVGDRLARHGPDPHTDVLITSGTRLSHSADFMRAARPRWWIAAGTDDDRSGTVNPVRCGAVNIRIRHGTDPAVDAWRNRERRFWRRTCNVSDRSRPESAMHPAGFSSALEG